MGLRCLAMTAPAEPKKFRHSISVTTHAVEGGVGQHRRPSFLQTLHLPDSAAGWRGSLSHLNLPTFMVTGPHGGDGAQGDRRFHLPALLVRRHSHNTLHRSESMASLCYKSLSVFINDNNLPGLQQYLDNKQVQVDDRDDNGATALMLAASRGRTSHTLALLSAGADPHLTDNDNWTALHCAARSGHTDICLQLIDAAGAVNASTNTGATVAASSNVLEQRDMGGWTPLMWAAYKGHVPTVAALLERGADVNVHGNYHVPSLLWAAGRGYTGVVEALLQAGAKVNAADKYGTTALIWASRRGHTDVVRLLLQAGAAVDTAGMYSWTALLVAAAGDHGDVVHLLLERRPNVNALDKDGCSALMLACKEGYYEVATALMGAGAYINVQDRAGDTNLIHAVKGGHRGVVEALLKRYADVDVPGKDRKTALYVAVEKGNAALVRLLLHSNPDLEVATKDADTALLKAVRSRNAEIVQVLLDKRAKPTAADRKGDTCLHIAMRARSRAIVEILLRNPKHSHLLYRPNRAGETPYNIDLAHQKTILGQIFGARRLNANEDNEGMLGYDLYSSALADILSEPTLTMPITVGLYAKWGSGKNFLLGKLRDEMKNFARHHQPPNLRPSLTLTMLLLHVALILGTVAGLAGDRSWMTAVVVTACFLVGSHIALGCLWLLAAQQQKHGRWALGDWEWAQDTAIWVAERVEGVRRVMQVTFCHPPSYGAPDEGTVQPIRFYFTEQTRVSTSSGGEHSVVQMVGSLYDAIEADYGSVATRLYRAFKPRPSKSSGNSSDSGGGSSTWTWRKVCCLPYIVLFEVAFVCALAGSTALVLYLTMPPNQEQQLGVERTSLEVILVTTGSILVLAVMGNLYTMARVLQALLFSQRRHLQRAIAKLDTLRSEGFLHALRQEVLLLQDMVRCLDGLSLQQQSRLVVIVDGLDSSEQEKVLLVLDSVRTLFVGSTSSSSPFIVILAIDPHVISRAVEAQQQRSQHAVGVGGHGYLANMVHLPFYLQNSGLRKVAAAQQAAAKVRLGGNSEEGLVMGRSLSARRLSSETALISASTERLGGGNAGITSINNANRKGSRKLRLSESVASSIGSNLNRLGSTIAAQTGGGQQQQPQHDLSRMLLTDDYFSDVNPRSMRRLMNVIYVTGRLLKAFKIDFSWYRLASWINITEQWPFRTSHLIHHFELSCADATTDVQQQQQQQFDDNTPLKVLYDRIRGSIPNSREVEPLLELDRGDERKFDVFLSYHRSTLQVADLKVFLPFTINLDPYLRKVIKEECCQQELIDASFLGGNNVQSSPQTHHHISIARSAVVGTPSLANGGSGFVGDWPSPPAPVVRRSAERIAPPQHIWAAQQIPMWPQAVPIAPVTPIPASVLGTPLSTLSLDAMCALLDRTLAPDISPERMRVYIDALRANNVSGRVLAHCELSSAGGGELRQLLGMTFGDWELFRVLVVSMRADEVTKMQMVQQPFQQRYHCHNTQPLQQQQLATTTEAAATTGSEHSVVVLAAGGGLKSDVEGSSSSSSNNTTKAQYNESSTGSTTSRNKQSIMEKQVTLEDQMICGALQTLNEEACEDVLEEVGLDMSIVPGNIGGSSAAPTCLIVPPSPDAALQQLTGGGGNTASADVVAEPQQFPRAGARGSISGETEFLILQSSPMGGTLPWQPLCFDAASDSLSLSDHNSSHSASPKHSPILENRASAVNLRMSSLKDKDRDRESLIGEKERRTTSTKHVVICADNRTSNCNTKLLSNSSTNCFNRPMTLNLLQQEQEMEEAAKGLKRSRSKSIDVGARKNSFSSRGLDTIAAKLRQRFLLHSNPELSDDHSNQSHTPLVNSSPSTSLHSPIEQPRVATLTKVVSPGGGSGSECSLSLSLDSSKLQTASSASLNSNNLQSPSVFAPTTLPPSV